MKYNDYDVVQLLQDNCLEWHIGKVEDIVSEFENDPNQYFCNIAAEIAHRERIINQLEIELIENIGYDSGREYHTIKEAHGNPCSVIINKESNQE